MTTFQTTTGMTTVAAVPVQQGPVIVGQAPQANMNVSAIRGLGITQIVFGILAICFGIGAIVGISKGFWVNESGSGIWFGLWIIITGILGVCSAQNPQNRGLNGTHMGFSIVCTVVSFFVGIFFAVGLGYYNNCSQYNYFRGYWGSSSYRNYMCDNKNAGIALYALLLILMIAEFFVSLVASVYCCQGKNGCCANQSTGIIIQQQPGYQVATSVNGQTFITTSNAYPATSYPAGYPATSVPYAGGQQQFIQQPYPSQGQVFVPQQMVMTQPPMVAQTNTTYSADQMSDYQKTAPPPYSIAS